MTKSTNLERKTKACTKCGRRKSTSAFYAHPTTRDKLCHDCKACRAESARRWHADNPRRAAENKRRWRADNPERNAEIQRRWYVNNR